VFYDFESESIRPVDYLGHYDMLKPNGSEFQVSYDDGYFPRVAVIEGSNPGLITSWQDSIPGVYGFEQDPNKLYVSIAAITPESSPEDPIRTYAYRVFNKDGPPVGGGTFSVSPVNQPLPEPSGIGWGVNVFNREDKPLSDREFSNHLLDADKVDWNFPEPEVLWFEVRNGWMFDSNQDASGVFRYAADAGTQNLLVLVTDVESGDCCYLSTAARVAMLIEGDSYLLIHALTPSAFTHPTEPNWDGILDPGREYTLALDDPNWPGTEYEFEDRLTVSGSNPNGD
jgi:hypothetical protein